MYDLFYMHMHKIVYGHLGAEHFSAFNQVMVSFKYRSVTIKRGLVIHFYSMEFDPLTACILALRVSKKFSI